MKKQYSAPTITIVKLQASKIICSSITGTSNVEGFGYGGNTEDNNITSGNSRRGSFWDDEE